MDFVFIVLGLISLVFGGEGILKGSVSLARRFGLSDFLVGAVIVGFGTSLPELSVSVKAALSDSTDLVLGNVVGSNIANILLIVGASALVYPITIKNRAPLRDALVVVVASAMLAGLSLWGIINFVIGLTLFVLLLGYLYWSYTADKNDNALSSDDDLDDPTLTIFRAILYVFGGFAFLITGAVLLVDGASALARAAGVSEDIIGLTLVAIGTSLPELATGLVASFRRHTDMLIGNILGSCLFNILAILSVTAMITPVPVSDHIAHFDVWIMLGASALLALFMMLKSRKIDKIEGAVMLIAYIAYLGFISWETLAVAG